MNVLPCSDQSKLRKSDPRSEESVLTLENESNRENGETIQLILDQKFTQNIFQHISELNSNALDAFILPEFDRVHSDTDKNKQVTKSDYILFLRGIY